jgi:hypothetical protein
MSTLILPRGIKLTSSDNTVIIPYKDDNTFNTAVKEILNTLTTADLNGYTPKLVLPPNSDMKKWLPIIQDISKIYHIEIIQYSELDSLDETLNPRKLPEKIIFIGIGVYKTAFFCYDSRTSYKDCYFIYIQGENRKDEWKYPPFDNFQVGKEIATAY